MNLPVQVCIPPTTFSQACACTYILNHMCMHTRNIVSITITHSTFSQKNYHCRLDMF